MSATGPCVLVTRPEADAGPLIAALQQRGATVLAQPMLRIDLKDADAPDLEGVQALLFSSANGVRAFARVAAGRALPVFAVGDATAAAAREAGFGDVASAGGAIEDLAALVVARGDPAAGALLHVAGSAVAGDLSGLLEAAGFTVRRAVLYAATPADALEPEVRAALAAGELHAVMFFSPRSAATFASVARAAGLAESCARVRLLALSGAVVEAAGTLSWGGVTVAAEPTQAALLAAFDATPFGETMTQNEDAEATAAAGQEQPTGALEAGADAVIDAFGGIRPMAAKLEVPVTTVQGWKNRGRIPGNRHGAVRAAAARHGVDLSTVSTVSAAPDAAPEEGTADRPSPPDAKGAVEAAPENESTPAPGRKSGGAGIAWLALCLSILAVAATVTAPYWSRLVPLPGLPAAQQPAAGDLDARLAPFEAAAGKLDGVAARLADLDRRLAALSGSVAKGGGAVDPAVVAALRRDLQRSGVEMEDLADRLGTAEARTQATARRVQEAVAGLQGASAALSETVDGLGKRIAALEARPLISGERLAALAVSLGQLEAQLGAGAPYDAALGRLRGLAEPDKPLIEALVPLAANAGRGIPTLAVLARRFDEIAPKLTAKPKGAAEPGLIASIRDKALSLVNMRKVSGDDATSPVTRAERAVRRGDLSAAVAALDGVGDAAGGWVTDAKARIAADRAIDAVQSHLVGMLAAAARSNDRAGPDGTSPAP